MVNVFIIGSKGIPAKYGGFETFVDKLTEKKVSKEINYYVSCYSNENNNVFGYNSAQCFNVKIPNIGSASAILYDLLSLNKCIKLIEEKQLKNNIIYILACRIGPFLPFYKSKLNKLGIKLYVNPDGHEWKRSKWNYFIKKYWKISEALMIKHTSLAICDSKNIEKYILKEYSKYNPLTRFISYGADINMKNQNEVNDELIEFYSKYNIKEDNYYLIVGRFVPENNYELIIKEFMASQTVKDLVIVSNVEANKFYKELLEKTDFKSDKRIKFVGTIYNQEILSKVREKAYGYIHGHEVGGTNPSLLEALASTKLNLLLDVNFNQEVGEEAAVYFSKKTNNLATTLELTDNLSLNEIKLYGEKAKNRILNNYSWEQIVSEYECLFLE